MKYLRFVAYVAVVVVIATSAQAALLNLNATYPLVTADLLTVSYDANGFGANGRMDASAWVDNWNPDGSGSLSMDPLGTFTAVFEIVPATGVGVSGTLLVTGDVNPDDGVLETLISSSTLIAFGFGVEDKFEAVFLQESGSLAPAGATIGVIIDARNITQFNSPTLPFFTDDFQSTGTKADMFVTGQIPEPGTLLLLGTGVLGAFGYVGRRIRA